MRLKIALNIGAGIVMLQKPFINTQEISHNAFNLSWSQAEKKEIKVIIIIQKKFTNKIMVEYKTDLINHPYVMLLEICKLDLKFTKLRRKTRVVNVYDNWVGRGYT